MNTFFLDIEDGPDSIRDIDGTDFPDALTARVAAVKALLGVVADEQVNDYGRKEASVDIWDKNGEPVAEVRLLFPRRGIRRIQEG